jgi:transposase
MNAYSQDLREKIVEAVFERRMSKTESALTFGVSLSPVKRYTRATCEGKCLAPKKRPGSKPKLDERARRLLEADVEDRPAVTLRERCRRNSWSRRAQCHLHQQRADEAQLISLMHPPSFSLCEPMDLLQPRRDEAVFD